MNTNANVSRLYHLAPMEVGTQYIESLTSYIKRLAEAHCVSPGILLSNEILPYTGSKVKSRHFITGCRRITAMSSEVTPSIVEILQNKTHNPHLEQMTMNVWNGFINPLYLFRKNKAWCPACFEESRQQNLPVYEQFIWSFTDIRVCNKHNVKLSTECQHCGCRMKLFKSSSKIGYCDNCGSWLGAKTTHDYIDTFDKYIYESIGSLLSISAHNMVQNNYFSENIKYLLNMHELSIRKFANILNLYHSVIENWIKGTKPILIHLINVSYVFGYTVIDLLTKDISNIMPTESLRKGAELKKFNNHVIDKEFVSRKIYESLSAANPPSISTFTKQVKISKETLKSNFPIEFEKIKQRHFDYMIERKQRKYDLIRETIYTLHNQGQYPGIKAVNRAIGSYAIADSKDREVWLSTVLELGYNPRIGT